MPCLCNKYKYEHFTHNCLLVTTYNPIFTPTSTVLGWAETPESMP